jgi:hypothetical protein
MAPIFQGLGTFVGRALYDSRIIDLHFNKVFLRAVLGDKIELSLDTLRVSANQLDTPVSSNGKLFLSLSILSLPARWESLKRFYLRRN